MGENHSCREDLLSACNSFLAPFAPRVCDPLRWKNLFWTAVHFCRDFHPWHSNGQCACGCEFYSRPQARILVSQYLPDTLHCPQSRLVAVMLCCESVPRFYKGKFIRLGLAQEAEKIMRIEFAPTKAEAKFPIVGQIHCARSLFQVSVFLLLKQSLDKVKPL